MIINCIRQTKSESKLYICNSKSIPQDLKPWNETPWLDKVVDKKPNNEKIFEDKPVDKKSTKTKNLWNDNISVKKLSDEIEDLWNDKSLFDNPSITENELKDDSELLGTVLAPVLTQEYGRR